MDRWEDFGQKVDLTARIREILINYPEGTSILKELIQVRALRRFARAYGAPMHEATIITDSYHSNAYISRQPWSR